VGNYKTWHFDDLRVNKMQVRLRTSICSSQNIVRRPFYCQHPRPSWSL